jgi:hypothetical protein
LGLQIDSILSRLPAVALREGGAMRKSEIEFFLSEMCRNAGSLTSTYRVVRKYNFLELSLK